VDKLIEVVLMEFESNFEGKLVTFFLHVVQLRDQVSGLAMSAGGHPAGSLQSCLSFSFFAFEPAEVV
jgi:hypothetical protein